MIVLVSSSILYILRKYILQPRGETEKRKSIFTYYFEKKVFKNVGLVLICRLFSLKKRAQNKFCGGERNPFDVTEFAVFLAF